MLVSTSFERRPIPLTLVNVRPPGAGIAASSTAGSMARHGASGEGRACYGEHKPEDQCQTVAFDRRVPGDYDSVAAALDDFLGRNYSMPEVPNHGWRLVSSGDAFVTEANGGWIAYVTPTGVHTVSDCSDQIANVGT